MTIPTTTIDEAGVHVPSYAEVLEGVKALFRQIYGDDTVLDADTQDGQLVGIFALAISDSNNAVRNAYNTVSPTTAQGVGLSRIVQINGIARNVPSRSTVDILIGGAVGTTISNGQVQDELGTVWDLPATVVIPLAGEITVTAAASIPGLVTAAADTITTILNPVLGWSSANNPSPASPGAPVETDAELRRRQRLSTGLPSRSVMDGIVASVAAVENVTRYAGLENDTDSTDANGIPSHSIAIVVEGGDATTIAETIALKKGPGCGTYGSTTEVVVDAYGVPRDISFSRPTVLDIAVEISLTAMTGYTSGVGDAIRRQVSDYINELQIGEDLYLTRLYVPASLSGGQGSNTYRITGILIAVSPGSPGSSNIAVAFDEVAACDPADVTLVVS
jgi:uncharacterized phage protein gp47/JayE